MSRCDRCGEGEAVARVNIRTLAGTDRPLTAATALCARCLARVCRAAGLDYPDELPDPLEGVPDLFEDQP